MRVYCGLQLVYLINVDGSPRYREEERGEEGQCMDSPRREPGFPVRGERYVSRRVLSRAVQRHTCNTYTHIHRER